MILFSIPYAYMHTRNLTFVFLFFLTYQFFITYAVLGLRVGFFICWLKPKVDTMQSRANNKMNMMLVPAPLFAIQGWKGNPFKVETWSKKSSTQHFWAYFHRNDWRTLWAFAYRTTTLDFLIFPCFNFLNHLTHGPTGHACCKKILQGWSLCTSFEIEWSVNGVVAPNCCV